MSIKMAPRALAIIAGMAVVQLGLAASDTQPAALDSLHRPFGELGIIVEDLRLRGDESRLLVPFGLRRDHALHKARLDLEFTPSPAMLRELSHIRVRLNGETVAALKLAQSDQQLPVQRHQIALDPRLFTDYNTLEVALVGHYTWECENTQHSSLWADISSSSALVMEIERLPYRGDLSHLPLPFFDPRDNRPVSLDFVFATRPDLQTLRSAGVLASWFGALSDYRGVQFKTHVGVLPADNAIVFAIKGASVPGIPAADQPSPGIALYPHPDNPLARVLVISGNNAEQLQHAASALVQAPELLNGMRVDVSGFQPAAARARYDVPNWLSSLRPVSLGELIDDPRQLETQGHLPAPVRVNFKLPPDLMTWNNRAVPMRLHYRYTPPQDKDNSSLSLSVNDQFLQAFRLKPDGEDRLRVPVLGLGRQAVQDQLKIPAFKLGSSNVMAFQFALDYHSQDRCTDSLGETVRAAIDPHSEIDLSGFRHYVRMPDLALFANAGYPFSRQADLAETHIVFTRPTPSHGEIDAYLYLLGHLGASTGLAATRFTLGPASELAPGLDRDILAIGMPEPWKALPRARIDTLQRQLDAQRKVTYEQRAGALPPQAQLQPMPAQLALISMESPLVAKRTVVALSSEQPQDMRRIVAIFSEPALRGQIQGDVSLLSHTDVRHLELGPHYHVGHLPWYERIWFHLSQHPVILLIVALLAVVLIGLALFWTLRSRARRRLAT